MLIKPFGKILDEVGSPTTLDTYIGIVADNNDPKKLGRVRVLIPLYEDMDLDDYPWACPCLNTFLGNSKNAISFNVPEIGSQVRVSFPTKDSYAPYYSGCEINEENKCTFFDEDYPNCYGSKDSVGNFIKINKAKKSIHMQHSSTLNLQIDKSGTFAVTGPNGTQLIADNVGNINLNRARTIQADCGELLVEAGAITWDSGSNTINGDLKVNGAFTPVAGIDAYVPLPNGRILIFTNGILTGYK